MAGPYYVDISAPAAWNGRTGLDKTTNCWLGISGLQMAFDTVSAGEICYIKGSSSNVENFYTLTFDAETGHLTDGEGVSWHDGTGVIHWTGADMVTPIELELLTGNIPSDGDVVTGATSTNTVTAHTGIARKTINIDTKSGTNSGGFIKYIGCNDDADFTVNGTRAILDMNSGSPNIVTLAANINLLWFENLQFQESGDSGFYQSGYICVGIIFINCASNNNADKGFDCDYISATFYRCVSYLNNYGYFISNSRFILCCARDNTWDGFAHLNGYYTLYFGCIAHNNNNAGIEIYNSSIINSISDANGNYGVSNLATTDSIFTFLLGNRITNHSGGGSDAGYNCNSEISVTGFNYYEDNTDNHTNDTLNNIIAVENTITDSNQADQADTNEGYVDKANHDFSTAYTSATDPHLRRTAITIPWS